MIIWTSFRPLAIDHERRIIERRVRGGLKHDKKLQWVGSVSVVGSVKPEDEWVWPWGGSPADWGCRHGNEPTREQRPTPAKFIRIVPLFFKLPPFLPFSSSLSFFLSLFHTLLHSVSPLLIPFPNTGSLFAGIEM